MMCFRDRSFCSASVTRCVNTECDRFFGPKQQAEADAWWEEPGAPVAFMNFEPYCGIVIKTVRMLAPALAGLKCLEPYLDMTLEQAQEAARHEA